MSKFQINELRPETFGQNEHWTLTAKRQSKTRPNIKSNISLILEEIIHKLFEGNIWLYTIMTSIFVRRNYIRHKSKNKWIRLLIKQKKGSNYWPYLFIKTRLFECNAAWKFQINQLRTLNVAGSSRSQCRKKAWGINSVRSWRRSMGRSQEIHY